MTRRLLVSYLTVTVVVLAVLEIPLGVTNARNERGQLTTKVERDAVALASLAEDTLESGARRPAQLRSIAEGYEEDTGGRVVVVDADGTAIVDSDPPAPGQRSFATRPEFQQALAGGVATGTRSSETLGTDLLYVAVPVASSGVVHGAVRVTYPLSAVQDRVLRYWLILAAIAALVLAAVWAIGLRLARSVAKPLASVEQAAAAASAGDLSARAPEADGPEEVRSLAASFNRTVASLDDLLRARDSFVADASHQLRTPLAALRLRLENLERDVAPEAQRELDAALGEVARLSRLVDGLLALARTDAASAHPEPVRLDGLVRERVDAWLPLAGEQDVELVNDVEGEPVVLATSGRLEQVLDNLIANALEVSPAGSAIRVTAGSAGGAVELRVLDSGPGMTPEQRARAFDRFWSGRAGEGGTGLGLAIVQRLVQADGGDVELREAPDGGLEALVRLRPAAQPPGERLSERTPAPSRG
jgi:signal transduction histidine kinase